jgi:hypothetical protein
MREAQKNGRTLTAEVAEEGRSAREEDMEA